MNINKFKNRDNKTLIDYFNIKKNIIIFSKNKFYHLCNSYHLGDNIFNLILFYNLNTRFNRYKQLQNRELF